MINPIDPITCKACAINRALIAKQTAIDEYRRLQEEEFYRKLPELKDVAMQQRAKYEAFMRERGFEP